ATFGFSRFSLTELAARAAASAEAGVPRVPGTRAGAEAVAARAAFDAVAAAELSYFSPVASLPGFPKALARTVHELRLAGIGPSSLTKTSRAHASGLPDLASLLTRVEDQLQRADVNDRAAIFQLAATACARGRARWANSPILLLDVPLDSSAEQAFVAALVAR